MKNRNNYPADWYTRIRPTILVRDNFKCKICGIEQGSINERTGKRVYLQIMHLDQDPTNNDEINLAAGCPACHFAYDSDYNHIIRISKRRRNGS